MVVGALVKVAYPSVEEINFLSFEPELFFFLLLPLLIFEAGYSLKKRDFFANFWTISLYAVFGTIISTFVIGYTIYWAALIGLVDLPTSSPLEPLIFGALISAVDPVATLSIMGNPELNCEPLLYSLVFGESVLNDAVAIVLFKTFMASYESGRQFSAEALYVIFSDFAYISLGSVLMGVFIGLVCSYLCKHTQLRAYPEYEISLLFLFAYGSYAFSEALNLSGILSLFFNGVVLSHYNSYNLSPISQVTAHNIFKSLATLAESFVYLYIGMGIFTGRFKHFHFAFFAICILACLLGRVANIFPLSFLANCVRRQQPIPLRMQVVMWFCGLRGAIAFALSQNMPFEHRELYSSTTLLVVIATTIVCGALTEPMMSAMGMRVEKQDPRNGLVVNAGSTTTASSVSTSPAITGNQIMSTGSSTSTVSSKNGNSSLSSSDGLFRAITGIFHRTLGYRAQGVELTPPDRSQYEVCTTQHSDDDSDYQVSGSLSPSRQSFITRIETEIMSPVFGGPQKRAGEAKEDDADLHCAVNEILQAQKGDEHA
eukprot:scaffold1463_cov189-Ochromonas_danica.AAC.8